MKISALVPTGHGINCELETKRALELAGFDTVDLVHINVLSTGLVNPVDYNMIVLPGGFLDGDDLGSAQACANRIKHSRISGETLFDRFCEFVHRGGLMLGICNGFQLLVKLGMLPAIGGDFRRRDLSLAGNDHGRFEDRWVYLMVDRESPCVFTREISALYLPVRHGEGKVIGLTPALTRTLVEAHQVPVQYVRPGEAEPTMEYPYNPNGSEMAIAGVCDPTGRVFGLMPHPEAYQHRTNHPRWTREELPPHGLGLALFINAVSYLKAA